MMKVNKKKFVIASLLLSFFVVWTVMITRVDVRPVGPNGSRVGFSTINTWFHELTNTHMLIYTITDWMGLIPVFICIAFGILGVVQWIKRRNLFRVDIDLIILGLFYIMVIGEYILFEMFAINYRPVLLEGILEASYPSSTTLLVLSVMLTTIIQVNRRIKNIKTQRLLNMISTLFMAFMVIGRLISGVHWLTDIVGGIILSFASVMFYSSIEVKNE